MKKSSSLKPQGLEPKLRHPNFDVRVYLFQDGVRLNNCQPAVMIVNIFSYIAILMGAIQMTDASFNSKLILFISKIHRTLCLRFAPITFSGLEVIKNLCSTQLSMKFQLLIKAKILKNNDFCSCQTLSWCIYPADKC